MQKTQDLACQVIAQVDAGRTLTEALSRAQGADVPPPTRAAVQDIGYGVLRHRGALDFMLRRLVPKTLPDADVERLLVVALYQLAHTRAAPYAVVDKAVDRAGRLARGRFKSLVNAVLRRYLRERAELEAAVAGDEVARYNHPQWWVDKLRAAYPDAWQQVLEQDNVHPPMTLRVNARHGDADALLAEFAAAGIGARKLGSHALMLDKPVAVTALPGFADGRVSVQDWGAQRAAPLLDLADGQRVLDACAAPGGKSGHILEMADVALTALDIDETRLARVQDNLARLGLTAQLHAADAAQPHAWWDGKPFDRILADVPCSAAGVVRRHPDIKWLRRPDDFAELGRQQAGMADALWPLLARGGKMLYATCSVMPEENQQQLQAFLARHSDARCTSEEQLLPSPDHDGFYYALLEKA